MKIYWPLLPFSMLYNAATRFRNHLYNIGQRKAARFSLCVVSVGNLAVGGTGKTPMTEYLIRLLQGRYALATLSRGYGRKTKGVLLAKAQSTAAQLGDEPMQIHQKFGPQVCVAVGEERVLAVPEIVAARPQVQVLLLDDAYQHRRIHRDVDLLLTDYARPFYADWPLPAGLLREGRYAARRAHVIVVSKCPPQLAEQQKADIRRRIQPYSRPGAPVFFASLKYLPPQPQNQAAQGLALGPHSRVALLSGLANPAPFEAFAREHFAVQAHHRLPDHHFYTPASLQAALAALAASQPQALLTTEKDMAKLQAPDLQSLLAHIPLFALPVEMSFGEEAKKFDDFILKAIQSGLA